MFGASSELASVMEFGFYGDMAIGHVLHCSSESTKITITLHRDMLSVIIICVIKCVAGMQVSTFCFYLGLLKRIFELCSIS